MTPRYIKTVRGGVSYQNKCADPAHRVLPENRRRKVGTSTACGNCPCGSGNKPNSKAKLSNSAKTRTVGRSHSDGSQGKIRVTVRYSSDTFTVTTMLRIKNYPAESMPENCSLQDIYPGLRELCAAVRSPNDIADSLKTRL